VINLRSDAAPRRRISGRRSRALAVGALVLTSAVVAGSAVSAQAASNIDLDKPITLLLGVGADESQRIASWYFHDATPQSLEIEETSDMNGSEFDADRRTIAARTAANTAADTSTTNSDTRNIPGIAAQTGYYNSHATITGLEENTSYSYRVGAEGHWSATYTFTTKSFDGDFDFLFFGDPQIGSSGNPDMDAAGWAATLQYATTNDPKAELLVSGGDQVENANNEYEWSAFADSSNILKQYPWAATIGNHEYGGKAYEQHNSVPNLLATSDFYRTPASSATQSGGDYWFMYKDVMFIDINSNAYAGGSDAAHVNYIRQVVDRFGDEAKWTVLVYHHSIYSPAAHADDTDNQQRRNDFTGAFSDLGIDMVLQGHDHSYSRSYAIKNGEKANEDEQPNQTEVFSGPGGVIYITANSASGSKYYDLSTPDETQGNFGPDPLDPTGERHWANSVENQEHVRTYVKVEVSDEQLVVANVRAGDCSAPNAAVELGNVDECGVTLQPTATADPAPVGSLVDYFALDAALPVNMVNVTTSTSSVAAGTPFTATATVSGGLGNQTGSVTFYDGSTALGTQPLVAGSATITVPGTLAAGSHSLSARFSTGSPFTGADTTSAPAVVTVHAPATTTPTPTVKAKSITKLDYDKNKGKVALFVKVKVKHSDAVASGAAKVYDGKKLIEIVKVTKGKGTDTVNLKKGQHRLHAVYVGTTTVASSSSPVIGFRMAR
jgi:hypothetical protein